jgi:ABC-2 type transport system ATP-binding protein
MSDAILRTRALSKRYASAFAIENVDVDIRRGQIYGLIGLNGAGKTTFMRVVTGLVFQTRGEVELFGRTGTAALQAGRCRTGQSIETPAIYPHMTAVENLEVQRIVAGVRDRTATRRTLEVVGLTDTRGKAARNFSLGMKQRLALAIALIAEPEFLVLDEPANGLDPVGIIEMRDLMRRLASERGITLLVSSHQLDELARVATHYGIIHQGRLVRQLSAADLAAESRQYLRIVTGEPVRAAALLTQHFSVTDFESVAGELRVYEQTDRAGAINALLVREGIVIEAIGVTERRLEEFFLGLTGGPAP